MLCIYVWADQFHSRVVSQFGRLAQNRIPVAKDIALANTHTHTAHSTCVAMRLGAMSCIWYGIICAAAAVVVVRTHTPRAHTHTHTSGGNSSNSAACATIGNKTATKQKKGKQKNPQAMLFRAQFPQLIPVLFILMTVPT